MSDLVDPAEVETIVGARRHPTAHLGRAVSADQIVYVMHSAECVASGIDLRACEYSVALDRGIDRVREWGRWSEDRVVSLRIVDGVLLPGLGNNAPREDRICVTYLPGPYSVGDRLKFPETKTLWWTVRAVRGRFVVCTQHVPFEPKGVLRYTVLDTDAGYRGPCNLIGQGWAGIQTDHGCRHLALSMSLGLVEISRRNNVRTDVTAAREASR